MTAWDKRWVCLKESCLVFLTFPMEITRANDAEAGPPIRPFLLRPASRPAPLLETAVAFFDVVFNGSPIRHVRTGVPVRPVHVRS